MQHKQRVKSEKLKVIILVVATLLFITCFFPNAKAQQSINAAGNNASGSGGSVSYSVGQVTYQTNTGANGSVAQGVQQPYEISVVMGIDEAKDINLTVSAYPNPTTDYLELKVDASTTLSIQSMSYQLYDITGKLLQSEKINANQTSIVMSNLAPATYFVKITEGNKELKTFKIIKN